MPGPHSWIPSVQAALRFLAVAALALVASPGTHAEEKQLFGAWRSVKRIHGQITIEDQSWIRGEETTGSETLQTVHVRFTMVRDRSNPNPPVNEVKWVCEWSSVSGSYQSEAWTIPYGNSRHTASFHGRVDTPREFDLQLDVFTGQWQIVSPPRVRPKYTVLHEFFGVDPDTYTRMEDDIGGTVFNGTAGPKPSIQHATDRLEQRLRERDTRWRHRNSRVEFWPEYDDVEVEVTIEGYDAWRPRGSIADPAQPGNSIVARAVLTSKGEDKSDVPVVDRFRFELLDTSREPGVCLNWPLNATDADYDLRFADPGALGGLTAEAKKFFTAWGLASGAEYDPASIPSESIPSGNFGTLSEDGLRLELTELRKDDEGRPFAEAMIESFDFGAKAELRVVCVLKDGREIVGVMKAEGGGQDLVRLPKRAGADWVAEAWRRENEAMDLGAAADDEKVEGQKHNGDGFTLYEEYRGWVVGGRHVTGDPKRKDFFVQNRIGPDARPGIQLFEQLSKLRVHDDLRRNEMDMDKRLMNGNRRDAPHRVAQHGVWVKAFASGRELGDTGAHTVMLKAGTTGRPGLVKGIGILARGNTESVFNQPFNLPAQDAIFAYDRAIAHELLHSVGVEHHGKGDYRTILGYVSPRNPANKVGRPYYGSSPDAPVGLLTEEGHDVAARDYPKYVELRQFLETQYRDRFMSEGVKFLADRAGYTGMTIHTPEQYMNQMIETLFVYCFMHLDGTVGVDQGEGSGDQDCVMRYYFAKFYEAKAASQRTLYVVTPGTERIGMELCQAAAGTGINAPGRKPQPRYGPAAAGAGNCAAQVCPNDGIPPRNTP